MTEAGKDVVVQVQRTNCPPDEIKEMATMNAVVKERTMKQGDLLNLSTEEYSDQTYSGPYLVLKAFLFKDIVPLVEAAFGPTTTTYKWQDKAGPEDVTTWLVAAGYIARLPAINVHLGSYGDIEITGVQE